MGVVWMEQVNVKGVGSNTVEQNDWTSLNMSFTFCFLNLCIPVCKRDVVWLHNNNHLGKLWCCLMSVSQVDDPLDAIAVHAFGGIWGLLAAGACLCFLLKEASVYVVNAHLETPVSHSDVSKRRKSMHLRCSLLVVWIPFWISLQGHLLTKSLWAWCMALFWTTTAKRCQGHLDLFWAEMVVCSWQQSQPSFQSWDGCYCTWWGLQSILVWSAWCPGIWCLANGAPELEIEIMCYCVFTDEINGILVGSYIAQKGRTWQTPWRIQNDL